MDDICASRDLPAAITQRSFCIKQRFENRTNDIDISCCMSLPGGGKKAGKKKKQKVIPQNVNLTGVQPRVEDHADPYELARELWQVLVSTLGELKLEEMWRQAETEWLRSKAALLRGLEMIGNGVRMPRFLIKKLVTVSMNKIQETDQRLGLGN